MKLVLLFALVIAVTAAVELRKAREWNRGSYIVTLRSGEATVGSHQREHLKHEILNMDPVNTIDNEWKLINAFSAHLSRETLEHLLTLDSTIELIEYDGIAHALIDCPNSATPRSGAWGIARVSEPDCSSTPSEYFYPSNPGEGTYNYILDTGVRDTHVEYVGRTFGDGVSFVGELPYVDGNGHGTHVAGTVAGDTVGMAFAGLLTSVQVLGRSGSGSWAGVISGIEWVVTDADDKGILCAAGGSCKNTANLSLGGGTNTAVDNAINAGNAAGVLYVIAAGNSNANACNTSPAGAAGAFTVGSTTSSNNARSSFSNYGTCVDIFAPGSSIMSSYSTSDTSYSSLSGTSMAAPHVAGAAALFQQAGSYANTKQLMDAIVDAAHDGCVGNPGSGSPNTLAFSC